MLPIDFTQIELNDLVTHRVGNKLRDEQIEFSNETTKIEAGTLEYLVKYFLLPFKTEELFSFYHSVKIEMNEIFSLAEKIFKNKTDFVDDSQAIAKLLYEYSMHPRIKQGELNVAYFKNAILGEEVVDAIGIFKSENNIPFIKMNLSKMKFSIDHQFGYEIKGMDKGCIIFNSSSRNGFRVLITDAINKSTEAQYWKDEFLKLRPINNEFHQTNQFLNITKNFVTKQIPEEFTIDKSDRIELLNRSVDYFKKNETFDKSEFENAVFHDEKMLVAFRKFDEGYRQTNDIELADNFEISSRAVKRQARAFKNVLKLDKNFHIYIHGNADLIERGIEADGRKYYKIYYKAES
jgi:hypothetical protein